MTGRELLDIAAEYVEARQAAAQAEAFGLEPAHDLDAIAARWDRALADHLANL